MMFEILFVISSPEYVTSDVNEFILLLVSLLH